LSALKQIAITGATGFLGHHISAKLIASGVHLRALVRDKTRATALSDMGAELIIGDLDNAKALETLVQDCDCVVHVAGAIKAKTSEALIAINGGGTANLVAACDAVAAKIRLVHISSITAREPQLSAYANSKAASEQAANRHNGPVVIIRPNAVYGPGDRETLQVFKVAQGLFQPLFKQPDARIAMIHVDDAAQAVLALCDLNAPIGLFEIADAQTQGYGWLEITKTAVLAVGGRARLVPIPLNLLRLAGVISENMGRFRSDPPIFNRGKVREILHGDWAVQSDLRIPADIWFPKINLEQGFCDTVNWYRSQGWL